jgi:hypothetical protein
MEDRDRQHDPKREKDHGKRWEYKDKKLPEELQERE